jgi:hypothetical protein
MCGLSRRHVKSSEKLQLPVSSRLYALRLIELSVMISHVTRPCVDLCKESINALRQELEHLKVPTRHWTNSWQIKYSIAHIYCKYSIALIYCTFTVLQATEWMFDDKKISP